VVTAAVLQGRPNTTVLVVEPFVQLRSTANSCADPCVSPHPLPSPLGSMPSAFICRLVNSFQSLHHSYRSATMGSTRIGLRAGTAQPSRAADTSTSTVPAKVKGPFDETPISKMRKSRVVPAASAGRSPGPVPPGECRVRVRPCYIRPRCAERHPQPDFAAATAHGMRTV
jgi:hypothetical protein